MVEYARIRPGDEMRVLLPANRIPDGSVVTKRTGEATLILRHELKVYPVPGQTDGKPVVLQGSYLVSHNGNLNQIANDLLLMLVITAEGLHDLLQEMYEPETSQ